MYVVAAPVVVALAELPVEVAVPDSTVLMVEVVPPVVIMTCSATP